MNDNQQDQIERYLDQRKKQEEPGEMSGQEQKRKINFIKQHIVDNYKADQQIQQLFAQYFLNYLKENKGINTQEHNLDLLSFDEIEDIVNGFQKMNPLKIIQEKRKNRISQSVVLQQKHNYLQQDKVQMKDWNARKVYYSNGAWDYELNGYQQCKREKAYFLQNSRKANKIQIAFSKYETKKSGGFFGIGSTLQLWISMKGPIIKEQVARTAEDFIFLRQALKYTVPFSYIPPLDINENTLKKVDNEEIRAAILKQCLSFINAICNNEELIQNFYTFRFFTEIKYQNYLNLKKSFKQPIINHTKLLKNRQGCVEIQISDRNQLLKKDYGRKSQHLQKIWRFVGESNSKIEQKMKQIQTQINFQKKELKAILEDIGNSNQILKSASYEKLTEVLCCYNDVYKVYQENMMNIRQFFRSVSKRLSNQAQKNWKAFSDYKDYVFQYSNEYQARRKGFLQKGLPKPGKTQQPINKQKNSKISIISDLGIDDASEREITWIQRYSKWQAYINRKFVLSFEDLVDSDRETLRDIMQTTAQKTLQFRGKEQMSFISHLSVISA